MAYNWKVGERAVVDCPRSDNHGSECTIMAVGVPAQNNMDGPIYLGIEVDLRPSRHVRTAPGQTYAVFRPYELKPIREYYDGLTKTTWDECPWKPAVLA